MNAAIRGDLVSARRMLKQGAHVDGKYEGGTTALMLAAGNDRTEVVRLLLDKGANVAAKNIRDETALSDAAEFAKTPTLELLLDHGADPTGPSRDGRTPLVLAAERGNYDALALFLARGATLEQKNAALLSAAHGVPVAFMENRQDSTMERYTAPPDPNSNYARAIRLLLQNGAQIEAKDKEYTDDGTALIAAATYGETDAVNELLNEGANVDAKEKNGYTALIAAACDCAIIDMPDTYETMKLLLKKRADPNAKSETGTTALMAAVTWSRTDNMNLLLDYGANIDARDNDGNTALMVAAPGGAIDLTPAARLLIENGANVQVRNKRGETALTIAEKSRNQDVVRLLMKR